VVLSFAMKMAFGELGQLLALIFRLGKNDRPNSTCFDLLDAMTMI